MVDAGVLLLGERVTVVGGTAFQDVGDVHRLTGDPHGVQVAVKQLARRAHEGDPLLVLGLSGGFANKHEVCLAVAYAEHEICACLAKRTGLAALTA